MTSPARATPSSLLGFSAPIDLDVSAQWEEALSSNSDAAILATLARILPLDAGAPPSLRRAIADEVRRLALGPAAHGAATLAAFGALTDGGADVSAFGLGANELLARWLAPESAFAGAAAAAAVARNALQNAAADDAVRAALGAVLAVHCARGPTPAFTRLCLESIRLAVDAAAAVSANAESRTAILAALCLVAANKSTPKESWDLAFGVIKSLVGSKSLKISRAAVLDLCNFLNTNTTLKHVFPKIKDADLAPSSLFRSGAVIVLSELCFIPKPILEEFTTSNGVRRMILSFFVSSSRLDGIPNSEEQRPEESSDSVSGLHNCLLDCIRKWILADGISMSCTDWEDVLKILENMKGYIFEHSMQSSQKFEIGAASVPASALSPSKKQSDTEESDRIEVTYIEVCSLVYKHFPAVPGAIPQTMYDLFLNLITLARESVVLSEPIMLATIDYACSGASWLYTEDTNASGIDFVSTTSMQTNISRLVYIYFKSRHIATIPPLYSLAQSRILEKIFMLLECSFEYESGILSSLSVTLLEVMRLVCDKPESFDENLVVEKVLDSAVVVARGSDEVVFKELVSLLKQASSGNSSNKNRNLQILAVKNLLRLFRFALVERNSLGSDVVFSAISDLSGDTKDVSVEVRAKCIDFLLSLRVLNGENVGISCSLELSEWLGFNKPMILKSSKLRAQSHSDSDTFSSSKIDTEMVTIDLNAYFTSLLRILKLDASWELYSLVIYNFHSQLKNVAVASHLISSSCVESMRAHFCEVVVSEIVAISVTNFPPNTRKSDLYLLVFKFLMTILLWDNQFSKSQTDDVLKCFLLGLTKWPTTARYCIQSLTLLLTELPSPMTRLVPELLMKVSRLTSASMAPSILEFLSTLARLPEIYVNLNEADYKRIFGIALGNIRAGSGGGVLGEYTVQLGYHVLSVWFVNMNVADRRKYVPFIIGHIVGDGGASGGTPGNGGGAGGGSSRAVDESVELVMDMLLQNSYADCAARPDAFEGEGATEAGGDGMASGVGFGVTPSTASKDLVERSWIQGNSVLSIRNLKMSGWVEVTVRRPSGTIVFSMKLENRARFTEDSDGMGAQIPAVVEKTATEVAVLASPDDDSNIFSFDQELDRQKTMASLPRTKPHLKSASSMKSIFHLESKSLPMDPSFILLQLSPYPPQALEAPCIPLPTNEEAFTRAIKVLDRTPVSDLHKIGVLYVGPSQNHELQILRNDSGSRSYTCFMCALGRLVRLKGLKKYNTGGLDTSEACVDGQNCLVWQDASSGNQIVFHTTTLMPTNEQTDPQCSLKKRHVGNDFVSVLFDESGGDEIGFDTLPGQFNFVNILVKPMGTVGFMKGANVMEGAIGGEGAGQSGLFLKEYEDQMFRVVMRVKPELNLPPLGLFSDDGFLVSGANLAGVVRRAAVHANMLALVVAQTRAGGGGFISNARERLRQIKRLADRAKKGITATPLTSGSQVEEMLDFTRFA